MFKITTEVRALLLDNPNIVSLIEDKIFPVIAPESTEGAQAAYWKDLSVIGAATPNEVRRENNLPRIENGDKAFVQVNVQTLDLSLIHIS